MQPLYFKIDNNLPLMIVPQSDAHVDGHPVLTYSYLIFRDENVEDHHYTVDTDKLLTPDRKNNPNYMGTLNFVQPGKIFSYEADGNHALEQRDIEEVIEMITHYRENSALWQI